MKKCVFKQNGYCVHMKHKHIHLRCNDQVAKNCPYYQPIEPEEKADTPNNF